MQSYGVSHTGKGQRKGFTKPLRATSDQGKGMYHKQDCKRKNRFQSIPYNRINLFQKKETIINSKKHNIEFRSCLWIKFGQAFVEP